MYRISFKGTRQPEVVPDARGKAMYDDFQTSKMPAKVEIRSGLTIESSSIRDIEYIPDSTRYPKGPTEAELKNFAEKELKRYLNDDGELSPANEIAFMVAKGLITVTFHSETYQTASDATLYVKTNRVREYQEMVDLIGHWKTLVGKANYGKRQRIKDLDELAAQTPVDAYGNK